MDTFHYFLIVSDRGINCENNLPISRKSSRTVSSVSERRGEDLSSASRLAVLANMVHQSVSLVVIYILYIFLLVWMVSDLFTTLKYMKIQSAELL